MKNKKAIAAAAIIGLVALIGILYAAYIHFAPSAVAGEKHITITIQFPEEEKQYELDTDAEYLREALESVAEISGEESEEFGFTLYSVDGVYSRLQYRQRLLGYLCGRRVWYAEPGQPACNRRRQLRHRV